MQDRLVQYGELTEIAEDQIFRKKEEGVKVVKREPDLLVEHLVHVAWSDRPRLLFSAQGCKCCLNSFSFSKSK